MDKGTILTIIKEVGWINREEVVLGVQSKVNCIWVENKNNLMAYGWVDDKKRKKKNKQALLNIWDVLDSIPDMAIKD